MGKLQVFALIVWVLTGHQVHADFSIKNVSDVPHSIDEIKEAKLWITGQYDDPVCALNLQTIVAAIYDQVEASRQPHLEFWNHGQPSGPAIAITIRSAIASVDQQPPRCAASISYQFVYFGMAHDGPQARIIYAESPNTLRIAPSDAMALGSSEKGISEEVASALNEIIDEVRRVRDRPAGQQ
jgi:hypothetical protein